MRHHLLPPTAKTSFDGFQSFTNESWAIGQLPPVQLLISGFDAYKRLCTTDYDDRGFLHVATMTTSHIYGQHLRFDSRLSLQRIRAKCMDMVY